MQTSPALPDSEYDLVPSYDWCDGRCPRCPLRHECALSDLVADSEDAPPEGNGFYQTLRQAGLDYSITLSDLAREDGDCEEGLDEHDPIAIARHAAAVIGLKVARIAEILALESPGDALPEDTWDIHLNLLLIERLDETAVEAAWFIAAGSGKLPDQFLEAHARLFALLGPLLDRVPEAARNRLDELIINRRAPSPFCMLDPPSYALLS